MYFQIRRENAIADTFLWFLAELHRELNNSVVVIWDRLGAHRNAGKALHRIGFRWIKFEYLPGYCLQLNPVEHVWSTLVRTIRQLASFDINGLHNRVGDEVSEQCNDRQLLSNHFKWAGVPIDALLY